MVAFEKRYHGISSKVSETDIQTKEECVLECFKPGMAVWDIENLFSECFKPGTGGDCGISLWLCELSGLESLWN